MFRQNYPAKVLLFGEHTVLRGGRALAVPNPAFGLQWTLKRWGKPDSRLVALLRFLERNSFIEFLELGLFHKDIQKGWRLVGNVPYGYGVGSSGVVCAAIWHRYGKRSVRSLEPIKLRGQLGRMESFYHGSSSGTDPLISYLNQPVVLSDRAMEVSNLPIDWAEGFFLLDTRQPRQSAPLIEYFISRFDEDLSWRETVQSDWIQRVDDCISALIAGDRLALQRSFTKLSETQLNEVPNFIPPAVRPFWKGKYHHLKLCGAGGGGFMLGLTENWAATRFELEDWKLIPLF